MTRKGPLITLLGGGALAAVLLVASVNAATGDEDNPDSPDLAADGTVSPSAVPESSPAKSPAAEEPAQETYVGFVDGGGASVAIIVAGDEATAYVCDGYAVESWLTGPAVNGELALTADNGDLLGSYDGESAAGEATVEGQTFTFTVGQVDPPEGLYQFADTVVGGAEVQGAWIVLPDGTQVGVAVIDGEVSGTLDESDPAPRIDPETGEVVLNGVPVTARRLGGEGGN